MNGGALARLVDWSRISARNTGNGEAKGIGNVVVTGVAGPITLNQFIADVSGKELELVRNDLADTKRQIEQLRKRESDLEAQVVAAIAERDRAREEYARAQGALAESRATVGDLQQRLTDQAAAWSKRYDDAERQSAAAQAALASVRGQLQDEARKLDKLESRRSSLAATPARAQELFDQDGALATLLAVLLLLGAVFALLLGPGVNGAGIDVLAAPVAMMPIAFYALIRGRVTVALSVMLPMAIASWATIMTVGQKDFSLIPDSFEFGAALAICGLAPVFVVYHDFKRRRAGRRIGASHYPGVAGSIIGVCGLIALGSVLMALRSGQYIGLCFTPFVAGFAAITAQSTWEVDRPARRISAASALLYATTEILVAIDRLAVDQPAKDDAGSPLSATATSTVLVLYSVFAFIAALALYLVHLQRGECDIEPSSDLIRSG